MAINSKTMAYGLVKDILFMVGIWRQSLADLVVETKVEGGQSWLFRAVVYRLLQQAVKEKAFQHLRYEVAKVTYAHNFFQQPRARLCMVLFVIVKYAT